MVAPKRKWTDVLGHSTNRIIDHNKILRDTLSEIVVLHQPLSEKIHDKCKSCEDDVEWPCATFKLANDALARTTFRSLLDDPT